jgi:NAD(P)-dependent dehydrogenase (short-subunit alcohol dehydrogenase family)
MGQVDGKIALVTGGASGIGAACAETLARNGATVVVSDIDDPRGTALISEIGSAGGQAFYLSHDVTDEQRWQQVVAEIERRSGRLDILIANAGIGIMAASIVEMSLADWRRQTAINLDGVFLSVKYCLPLMRKSGGGSIVMTSSIDNPRPH